jgi:hypothetical protein
VAVVSSLCASVCLCSLVRQCRHLALTHVLGPAQRHKSGIFKAPLLLAYTVSKVGCQGHFTALLGVEGETLEVRPAEAYLHHPPDHPPVIATQLKRVVYITSTNMLG